MFPPSFQKNSPRRWPGGVFVWTLELAEVALQQALEGLAVSRFVAGHLVHGVVDGVQVVLLGQLGQLELAQGGAVLSLDPHLQVLLGGVGHHVAQQLRELGGVLGLVSYKY